MYASDYQSRIDYAARCINEGRTGHRKLDNCFEMYDGDQVVGALIRRGEKSPQFMTRLKKVIAEDVFNRLQERYKNHTLEQLAEEAKNERNAGVRRMNERLGITQCEEEK